MFWFIFITSIYLTILVLVSIFRKRPPPLERRVALVIGNAAYTWDEPLEKAGNDAADVADALRRLGFYVVEWHDRDFAQMRGILRDFKDKASAGGLGIGVLFRSMALSGSLRIGSFQLMPISLNAQSSQTKPFGWMTY